MIDHQQIRRLAEGHSIIREIDVIPRRGHVRIQTGFFYPDGSSVDVFLVNDSTSPLLAPDRLSDLGQTHAWLLDVHVKPWLSPKRRRFLEDALRLYDVEQNGGALERTLPQLDRIVDGVIALGQACVRVADLSYTKRSSLQTFFSEDLEEFFVDSDFPYEPNKELVGKYGKLVRVDFLVKGPRVESGILSLSSGSASAAHGTANEIFRRWHDLSDDQRQHLTVFDDRVDVYREDDLLRLKDVSDVIPFSDRQGLTDLIAAAAA